MSNNVGNIVNRTLTKEHLNNEVFKQLSEGGLPYISKETIEFLKKYQKPDEHEAAKGLWKNLLIDSICILKINDSREKLYNDCKNKEAFISNFSNIRKTSSFGIDELENYFNDFIDFECVLYGTDEHYRDHVDHVLQVWAIGISLISHHKFIFNDKYKLNDNNEFHFDISDHDDESKDAKDISISKSEFWAMWTIIALCHDLGYPIEKTSKINKQAKKIISHFGNMNFSELNYSFDIFNTFLVDKFLNVISSKATFSDKTNLTMIQTKYRDKFSKSLEDYKHGIFSSLLLYKNLTYFLETDYFVSRNTLDKEDLRQFFIRKEILRSIASHTCPKIYHIDLNTLHFLLLLCDELQEWNRPKFDEMRLKVNGNEPDVQLKEFDMQDKQKIHIYFKYNFDLNENDKKFIIDKKFKTIHCLLRTAKDDKDRKIEFIWEIELKTEKFKFSFDSNQNSFDLLNVSKQIYSENTKTFDKNEPYEIYT